MIIEHYFQTVQRIEAKVVQTKIDAIMRKNITKTGVRIYDGKYMGVAGAVGNCDLKKLQEQAAANLELKIDYPFPPTKNLKKKVAFTQEPIPAKDFIPEVEELLNQVQQANPQFSFSQKISWVSNAAKLTNTAGLNLDYANQYLEVSLLIKDKKSSNIMDAFFELESRRYQREVIIRQIKKICDSYQKVIELPKQQRFPVVFFSTERLPVKKLLSDLNGWKIGTQSSQLADKMGKKVFHENFSFLQSHHPDDTMGPFFDAEGTVNPGYKRALIKNGVPVSPYTDKKCAAKFKLPHSGSACADYDEVPSTGLSSWTIAESKHSIKALLGGKPGILVYIAMGGDFSARGDFSTPVQLAYLFDGEKLLGRLPPISISSNLFDMFGHDYRGVSQERVMSLDRAHYLVMEMKVTKS
jgi:PmbA protein